MFNPNDGSENSNLLSEGAALIRQDQATESAAKQEQLEQICTLVDLMEIARDRIEEVVKNTRLIHESIVNLHSESMEINHSLVKVAVGLKAISMEATKPEPIPEAENAQNEQPNPAGQEKS